VGDGRAAAPWQPFTEDLLQQRFPPLRSGDSVSQDPPRGPRTMQAPLFEERLVRRAYGVGGASAGGEAVRRRPLPRPALSGRARPWIRPPGGRGKHQAAGRSTRRNALLATGAGSSSSSRVLRSSGRRRVRPPRRARATPVPCRGCASSGGTTPTLLIPNWAGEVVGRGESASAEKARRSGPSSHAVTVVGRPNERRRAA
jgi:hypothetical protein